MTAVSPITVLLFAGPNRLPAEAVTEADAAVQRNPHIDVTSDSDIDDDDEENGSGNGNDDEDRRRKMLEECRQLKLDEWTVFKGKPDVIDGMLQLRQKWSSLFLRKLASPAKPMNPQDLAVLDAVIAVLSLEEAALGLKQPSGIGKRPIPVGSNEIASHCSSEFAPRNKPGGGHRGTRNKQYYR